MKVVLTQSAFDDLLNIGQAISQRNPARAVTFVEDIQDRCRELSQMPLAFPLLPNWEEQGIRRRVFHDYLIFYRVEESTVQVLHVLHGAMDYERILFRDAPDTGYDRS